MFDAEGAKCRETDPEVFFPESHPSPRHLKLIINLCSNCPVFTECRDYALQHDLEGYWAGMSRTERRKKQKQLNIEPKPILQTTNYWLVSLDAIKEREAREKQRKVS